MAEIAKDSTGVSLSTPVPGLEHKLAGDIYAGEPLATGDACYIAADGNAYRCNGAAPAAITNPASAPTAVVNNAPNGPDGAGAGQLPPGTYLAKYTLTGDNGETLASPESANIVIATRGQIPVFTLPTPPAAGQEATIYLTAANGASGSETFYADGITTATFSGVANLPTAGDDQAHPRAGAAPPVANTTSGTNASVTGDFHGIIPMRANTGDAITLMSGVTFKYAQNLTPGGKVYLSGAVIGGLATTPVGSNKPVGFCVDTQRIRFVNQLLN